MCDKTERIKRRTLFIRNAALVMCLCAISSGPAGASDISPDENNGEIYVHGVLTEGACRLDMTSVYQEVELGTVSSGRLHKAGSTGESIPFRIRFTDCLRRNGGIIRNNQTSTYTRDVLQPVVSLTFIADTDPVFTSLLSVTGVKGLALLLQDGEGHDVIPGVAGRPYILTPENDELVYTVTPVRTANVITAGKFRAVANFQVNYD